MNERTSWTGIAADVVRRAAPLVPLYLLNGSLQG